MRVKQDKMRSLAQAILPIAELNRQLVASDLENVKGRRLHLDLPVTEVNAAKLTLETLCLHLPNPRIFLP